MLLEGLQLPLTTPFYPDGRLNLPKLEHNAARYSKTPIAGLGALTDCGEPTMLSEEETRQVLRSVADAAAAEKVLMAGVSRDSVAGTLDLAETAARLGYDAVLVKRPSVFQANVRGENTRALVTYFQAVADRSALPVVLYQPGCHTRRTVAGRGGDRACRTSASDWTGGWRRRARSGWSDQGWDGEGQARCKRDARCLRR